MINRIIERIKKYLHTKKVSKEITSKIIKDLKKLDHTKWYNPKIKHSECHGYGFFKPGTEESLEEDVLVPDIFHRCHPDIDYVWYDGPFSAYPKNIDTSLLTSKDLNKLMYVFRKYVYK